MDSAITRLLKVLDLERKQGYRNKAVIGGLGQVRQPVGVGRAS